MADMDSATLTQRLRQEAVDKGGVIMSPIMVGAFARKRNAT